MLDPSYTRLAVAAVLTLILVDAYGSQYLLLDPVLTDGQLLRFNIVVAFALICYARVIFTSPGSPPPSWEPRELAGAEDAEEGRGRGEARRLVSVGARWCRKCEGWKPPRAHHCKACGQCILRMDHHCPWSANCIGYRNLPHFLRFLLYGMTAAAMNGLYLFQLGYELWQSRDLPSYLAPHSVFTLILFSLLNAFELITMLVLFLRTVFQTGEGYSTIETWEQSRHKALVRRRAVRKVVFPYDVGIWENLCCAFGYRCNPLNWLNPFAPTPEVGRTVELGPSGERFAVRAGLEWEVNGFEDPGTMWPPPDPEKAAWRGNAAGARVDGEEVVTNPFSSAFAQSGGVMDVEAFRRRQTEDMKRWAKRQPGQRDEVAAAAYASGYTGVKETRDYDWLGDEDEVEGGMEEEDDGGNIFAGVSAPRGSKNERKDGRWRNEDGDTLADYGVDEDVEANDEDVPLAVLMRRRRARTKAE